MRERSLLQIEDWKKDDRRRGRERVRKKEIVYICVYAEDTTILRSK